MTWIKKSLRLTLFFIFNTPTYLDTHDMGNMTEEQIKQAQNAPMDEFGVTIKDMLYNKEANVLCCISDAPNKVAVGKHHLKFGLKCDWITEVKTTA
ncbi:MAG: nickel-binding protein [Nitrososphaera sp.]